MQRIFEQVQHLWVTYGVEAVKNVLLAVLIFIIGRWVALAVKALVQKVMERSKQDETLIRFTSSLVYIALIAFVIIASLDTLGIPSASFVAVVGAAGLAIGLALQGSLSNFAAGVLMIIFKPFKVGDFVEGAGVSGSVEEISIFTTMLKSPDNKLIIIPNAKMTGDNIVNYSAKDTRRVDLIAGCSYSDDLDKVKTTLDSILSEDERILKDPEPTVAVLELADSSVNFVVRPWVKTEDYWAVLFATQKKIKQRFDAEGISIPFPQQDVHIIKDE